MADYDLGDAGCGSGDVLLGSVARSGHLKDSGPTQVLVCREESGMQNLERKGRTPPAPAKRSECEGGKGTRRHRPPSGLGGPEGHFVCWKASDITWAESDSFFFNKGGIILYQRLKVQYISKLQTALVKNVCTGNTVLSQVKCHVKKANGKFLIIYIGKTIDTPSILWYEYANYAHDVVYWVMPIWSERSTRKSCFHCVSFDWARFSQVNNILYA